MGKVARVCVLGMVAMGVACEQASERKGAGTSCRRDDDCAYGTVCASIEGRPRACTADVRGLYTLENPEVPGQEETSREPAPSEPDPAGDTTEPPEDPGDASPAAGNE
ncbi:MAG: hypothetical protein DIU78_021215 [Pseudomonadota bacterium]|nr:MAG: hypothetical protein DIU78_05310 [Pseudomonadota bacterium]